MLKSVNAMSQINEKVDLNRIIDKKIFKLYKKEEHCSNPSSSRGQGTDSRSITLSIKSKVKKLLDQSKKNQREESADVELFSLRDILKSA